MKAIKYMEEDEIVRRGVSALYKELGPMEARRFLTIQRPLQRDDSVQRHRKWQSSLDKNVNYHYPFFLRQDALTIAEIFGKISESNISRASEDLLTSDVFQLLHYVPPSAALIAVAGQRFASALPSGRKESGRGSFVFPAGYLLLNVNAQVSQPFDHLQICVINWI
jgi:hypothetical protein